MKSYQKLAPNSVNEGVATYAGHDSAKLAKQSMPNTRANDYVTNKYAGGGVSKTKAKVKGQGEHREQEDELGDSYGN